MRFRIPAAVLVVACCIVGPPAFAASDIGIVLMHGKQGAPDRLITGLAGRLEGAGYRVERPEMCFSGRRIYDLAYQDCFRDIDGAIGRLRAAGARRIVIAGQSLGGNMAIGYGATHDGLAGIAALAPAADASTTVRNPAIAAALGQAQLAQNQAVPMTFAEVNTGRPQFTVTTTPAIYRSFHTPGTLADLTFTTPKLHAPLLWVAGAEDPTQSGPRHAFAMAPPSPLNRYESVASGHYSTPDAAGDTMLAWLAALPR
jgi:dienelactone hydrolase